MTADQAALLRGVSNVPMQPFRTGPTCIKPMWESDSVHAAKTRILRIVWTPRTQLSNPPSLTQV